MKIAILSMSVTILLSFIVPLSLVSGTDIGDDEIGYPDDTDDFDETNPQKRRLSSFVRIGRGLSSFIRIGKNGQYVPYDETVVDDDDFGDGYPEKRLSSFVRIGRGSAYPRDYDKRAGAFVRVGKFPSSGYFRSPYDGNISPYYHRTGRMGHSSFIRIGKREASNAMDDLRMTDDLYRRYLDDDTSDIKSEDKKLSSFVRIGRPSAFVRIGRPGSLVEIDRPVAAGDGETIDDTLGDEEQKRMSKFVRIGKNKEELNDDMVKRRLSSFVRIGRKPNLSDIKEIGEDVKRRLSSFVRIGKSVPNEAERN